MRDLSLLVRIPEQEQIRVLGRSAIFRKSTARCEAWSGSEFKLSGRWSLGLGMVGAKMGGKLFFALQFKVPYHFN